jgi:hypothetical protein
MTLTSTLCQELIKLWLPCNHYCTCLAEGYDTLWATLIRLWPASYLLGVLWWSFLWNLIYMYKLLLSLSLVFGFFLSCPLICCQIWVLLNFIIISGSSLDSIQLDLNHKMEKFSILLKRCIRFLPLHEYLGSSKSIVERHLMSWWTVHLLLLKFWLKILLFWSQDHTGSWHTSDLMYVGDSHLAEFIVS